MANILILATLAEEGDALFAQGRRKGDAQVDRISVRSEAGPAHHKRTTIRDPPFQDLGAQADRGQRLRDIRIQPDEAMPAEPFRSAGLRR